MLTHLTDYHQYIDFLSSHLLDRPKFEYRFTDDLISKALFKMILRDVDSIFSLLSTRYSHTGRPAKNQIEILRSFILMVHFRYSSISLWCEKLLRILCWLFLLAVYLTRLPLLLVITILLTVYSPRIFVCIFSLLIFTKKHKDKPKKNKKLENAKPNTINDLVDSFNVSYSNNNDEFVQSFYFNLADKASVNNSLIDVSKDTVISGDRTALAIHSNPHGNKVCKCTGHCDYDRRYSHINADFGWDSDLGSFYFGYSGYSITTRNHKLKLDLPIFLTLAKATQHDSITSVTALYEFSKLNNNLIPHLSLLFRLRQRQLCYT